MTVKVQLYTRRNCHLCDEVKNAIRTAITTQNVSVDLQEIDIDEDEGLRRRFSEDVPVVFIEGVEAFRHRLTARQFTSRILGWGGAPEGLASETCVPCRGGVPALRGEAVRELAAQLGSEWAVRNEHHLEKEFRFRDFAEALAFTNRVGAVAEAEGHHADLLLSWGRVVVSIWTHKIDGLTRSDFVLAAKIDRVL